MARMRRFVLFLIVALSPMLMGANGCLTPTEQDDPVAFCSRSGLFYCNANGGPQLLQAQGFSGWCALAGNSGTYTTGYAGYKGQAGTPAYSTTSRAWADCASTGPTDRGWCLGVITCTRR
jgi:hypothetical protein